MGNVREACESVRRQVLGLRDPETGVWTGELAASALSTALAAVALEEEGGDDRLLAEGGAAWLAAHANGDGGWGDTAESVSNMSATLIAAAALRRVSAGHCATLQRAEAWAVARTGTLAPDAVARALGRIYGEDRTFAVPILAFLAMCGEDGAAWRSVPPLPFLMALLPQRAYRFFRLQVVSYALPALIAVGLCRHVCVARASRRAAWGCLFAGPLLRRLERLQPSHGGFLDAIPLTAFVCLALRHAGYGQHAVVRKGVGFLRRSARSDGSWAIDSNLRTWVTTLAARALLAGGRGCPDAERIAEWLVRTQVRERHPFTGACPGGWAWTDLPGGVPDADDTAGALIALKRLKESGVKTEVAPAVRAGVRWLLGLQNADGGVPTFCRGWGRLPFDRSCPDISAHALAALAAWCGESGEEAPLSASETGRVRCAVRRLVRFLEWVQEGDGSWVPLWFGHQAGAGGRNPVVGTARVVEALRAVSAAWRVPELGRLLAQGERWLLGAQHEAGGWGSGPEATAEETALAVLALTGGAEPCALAAGRGCVWLAERWAGGPVAPAPIGLYFSLLWYHERMYPLVWSLEALERNRG